MSEMIERVARALCRQYELDDGFSPEQADRAAAGDMHRNFIKAARATIEAMREPTDEMLAAGCAGDQEGSFSKSRMDWQAMIDEALK